MRVDLQHFGIHAAWGLSAGGVCASLVLWYCIACVQAREWLHGGSLPALACGVTAGAIILFEMLLAPRKWLRGWRLIPTKHWMAAHLWFGLASWPLAIVHCGFHLGGGLPTTFMIIFNLTIISGVYGWVLQNIIPKLLLKRVRSETIYSQIEFVSRRNLADAESMLVRNFGVSPNVAQNLGYGASAVKDSLANDATAKDSIAANLEELGNQVHPAGTLVVGAIRDVNKSRRRSEPTTITQPAQQDAERLWHALSAIKSFLLLGARSGNEFAVASHAQRYFANLRKACDPSSAIVIDALEEYCIQRREFDLQQRLHRWLHGWLPVHIGLSVGVTVLLFVHIITAIRYW